ncbi:MAG TPA: electron transfer flavoprotein subunit beta/FixA family protein [Candidatus Brocadiia bacterium]|nr:electron transfer flavoprotein subunit beta/FixA family protein [Candidatus Brocadiia bacterium]
MAEGLRIVVCVKQVPDLSVKVAEPLRSNGTINRAAFPAIINPDDLCALEMGLLIREVRGGRVKVVSMGPPTAAEALRDCLCRGADEAILICDSRFAGSDTFATAVILAAAMRRIGSVDLILCGRQTADGDTGQVGPELAGLLGLPQITRISELMSIERGHVLARRNLDESTQIVEAPLPCLLTVNRGANLPRIQNARLTGRFKKARAPSEVQGQGIEQLRQKGLLIEEWSADDLGIESHQCGIEGSPTRIAMVEAMSVAQSQQVEIPATEAGMDDLVRMLAAKGII